MQIEHSNEVELIRQTLAGDTSAFDRLVKIHRGTVYVLVLSYIKNPADAEDVTQRIFIRAYERLATLRALDRFPLWLQQIAHNACKDWLRRRHNSVLDFELMNCAAFVKTVPTPEDIALKREIETVVRAAIGALQETDRKLVEGRYIEGASYDQLQVESGLSYSAIASRLKRAKQQMRRRIEKLLGGMAVLPGRTFIWGGIETVKLSVKAKLAAVGIVAVLGIGGGGVWYHHTFESNPVIVNEQRVSEPEAATEDRLTEIQKTSTAESIAPEDWEQLDAFIGSLKALDETVEGQARPSEAEAGTVSSTEEVSDEAGTTQEPFIAEIDESLEPYKRTEVYRASLIGHFGDIPQVHTLADSALKGWLGIYSDLDEAIKNHEAMVHLYPGPSDAAEQLEVLKKRKQEQESGEFVTRTETEQSSTEMLNLKTQYPELEQLVNQHGPDGFREAVRRFSELNPEKATAFKRALWNTPEVQNALKSVDATELEEIKEFFGDIMTGSQK